MSRWTSPGSSEDQSSKRLPPSPLPKSQVVGQEESFSNPYSVKSSPIFRAARELLLFINGLNPVALANLGPLELPPRGPPAWGTIRHPMVKIEAPSQLAEARG